VEQDFDECKGERDVKDGGQAFHVREGFAAEI
jgi:hypothetical protein